MNLANYRPASEVVNMDDDGRVKAMALYICMGCGKRSPTFVPGQEPTGLEGWLHTTRDDSFLAPMVACSADCVEAAKAAAREEATAAHNVTLDVIKNARLVPYVKKS